MFIKFLEYVTINDTEPLSAFGLTKRSVFWLNENTIKNGNSTKFPNGLREAGFNTILF